MGVDILRVARPELEPSDELLYLLVYAVQAGVEYGPLAGLDYGLVDLALDLLHYLLDARGVDPAVGYEPFERYLGYLPAHGVMAGEDDRLRRVVYDDIYARCGFDGAYVAAFAPYYPALHLVVGQVDDRDRPLGDILAGVALYGEAYYLLGLLVGIRLRLLFYPLQELAGLQLGLVLHGFDQGAFGLFGGKPRYRLEPHPLLGYDAGDAVLQVLDLLLLNGQVLLPFLHLRVFPVYGLDLPVEVLLLGLHPALQRLQFLSSLTGLLLKLALALKDKVLGLKLGLFSRILGLFFRVRHNGGGRTPPCREACLLQLLPYDDAYSNANQYRYDSDSSDNNNHRYFHTNNPLLPVFKRGVAL